jgi:hypothetical protein
MDLISALDVDPCERDHNGSNTAASSSTHDKIFVRA